MMLCSGASRALLALLALLLTVALSALAPSRANAGGFYLLDRQPRAMGRGGAFVAGADDPGSLWYNPAGIGFAGEQLQIDATLTFLHVDYTRVDSGGNTLAEVSGNSAPLPIPTIAGTFDFGLENVTFGVGIFAPNAALMEYPEELNGGPAPQRYSLLSMQGSIIASLALGAAWRPVPELSIGLGVHVVYGAFAARTTLSACEGTICTFPEDPEYDAVAQLNLNPAVSAIGTFGVVWDPGPVRLGFSLMTPFDLSGTASIRVRTPGAAAFDGAFVRTREGDCNIDMVPDAEVAADPNHRCRNTTAGVDLDFPMILRFGAQLDLIENLALEVSVVWETWSFQRAAVVVPNDVWFSDALGGALDYQVGTLSIPRNMNDTVSIRLGGEYTVDDFLSFRLGGYFENGSFSDQWLQALTIDSDKIVVAGGASIRAVDGLWIDVMVGYAHLFPRNVTTSMVPQANPIRPTADPVYIGNGTYNTTAPFFGVGMRYDFDWQIRHATPLEPVIEVEPEIEPAPVVEVEPTYPEPVIAAPPEPEPEVAPEPQPEPVSPRARRRRRRVR
jgi:long-chain fatty acid transport protein